MGRLLPCRVIICLVTVFALMGGVRSASAQATLQNGTIFGTITDTSGGVLPGATVEVTGPALQGVAVATTDAGGAYRVSNLPAGTYKITYSMSGFQPTVRDGFGLTSGFNARVDMVLAIGVTSEQLTVTGQAPVIDTSTAVISTNLGRDMLDAIPTTRSIYQAVYMAPGIRPSNTPDVGGSQLGNQQNIGSYGFNGGVTLLIDGINGTQSTSFNGGDSPGNFVDYDSLEEFKVISAGGEADMHTAGTVVMSIMKSGGNQFHGDGRLAYQPHGFQMGNLASDPESNKLQYFYDTFGDLGGRIVKDTLWFYGGIHLQRNSKSVFGYTGPNGGQGYAPVQQDNSEAKLTYQPAKSVKIITDYSRATKVTPQLNGSPTIPFGSTYDYGLPFWNYKVELNWTPSSKVFVDVLGGKMWQPYLYKNQDGTDVPGNPFTMNQTTGQISGAMHNTGSNDKGEHTRRQVTASVSYFPNGAHSFQVGMHSYFPQWDSKEGINHPSGNYQLVTTGATAAATKPLQLITFNYPWNAEGKQKSFGLYAKDVWRVTSGLTINYGIRYDYNRVYHDEQVAAPSQFSLGGSFPALTINTQNRFSPRFGLAWDVTGSAKTILRATYGVYNIPWLGAFDLGNYNPTGFLRNTYNWQVDTCQVTPYTNCAPSQAFIDAITKSIANPSATTFNGTNIYSSTTGGGLNAIINPDLKMPFFHQFSATVERELGRSLAARASFVYNLEQNEYDQTFPGRPVTSYTETFNTVYPATDLVNAGKPIAINYYPAALKNANQTMFVNRDGNPDYFRTLEFTLNKRKTNKWSAMATASSIKNHKWLGNGAQPTAPYEALFATDETWDYTFKSYLTYDLPYKIAAAINYQFLAGSPNYATDQFNLTSQGLGTVTIPVEKYGSERAPNLNIVNLRFSKSLALKASQRLEVSMEIFNALNSDAGTTVNFINGTGTRAFGFTSAYMSPMVGRFGINYRF